MPSVSKAQQRFMGLVHAYKKGEVPASKVSKAVKDAAKSMKKKSTKDFAKTKHKGLPNKVRSENMNEDGHTDVASVERKLKLIIVDAVDTIKKLRSMSNDDSLPSWWTDKITLAKDYVSKSRDYIMNPAEGVDEGFGGELKGRVKQKFEKARKANGEQLGYKLTGTSDIKESVNEGKFNPNKIKIHTNKAIGYLKQAQKFAKEGQKGAVWQRIGDARDELKMTDKFLESVDEIFPKGAGRKISKAMQKGIEPQGNIKKVLDVAKNQQSKKIGGTLVDLTTANLMTQVWNKVNDSSKEKMNKMNAKQLTNLILRIWKGVGTPRV